MDLFFPLKENFKKSFITGQSFENLSYQVVHCHNDGDFKEYLQTNITRHSIRHCSLGKFMGEDGVQQRWSNDQEESFTNAFFSDVKIGNLKIFRNHGGIYTCR